MISPLDPSHLRGLDGGAMAKKKTIDLEFFRQTGAEGGKARASKLSPERRSEIAKIAVEAREAKRKGKKLEPERGDIFPVREETGFGFDTGCLFALAEAL